MTLGGRNIILSIPPSRSIDHRHTLLFSLHGIFSFVISSFRAEYTTKQQQIFGCYVIVSRQKVGTQTYICSSQPIFIGHMWHRVKLFHAQIPICSRTTPIFKCDAYWQ